jgi:DNA-binding CsgD family transcriptional regulator/PAS domain-containing protein
MARPKNSSWFGYIDSVSHKSFDRTELPHEAIERVLTINQQQFSTFFYHSVPVIYLLDYTTGEYLSMSKSTQNILGESADNFITEGIGHTVSIYHKEDLKLFNKQIFPDRLEILRKMPAKDQADYIFSYNYRLKNKSGGYTNLLQRNCFIKSDEQGNPLLSFGIILNIEHYKTARPVIQTVDKVDDQGVATTVFKKNYYQLDEDQLISKREVEVLKWMAEGYTSKEIGEKMNLSEHTIIAHRRKMHEKTNINSATALIYYAVKEGLI